jgi:hypothetical protein
MKASPWKRYLTPLLLVWCGCGCAATGGRLPPDMERLPARDWPKIQSPASVAQHQSPLHVKVLVLEFNPLVPGSVYAPNDPQAPPKGLRQVGGWNDPLPLAAGYMQDICDASGGLVQLEIADWLVVHRFQKKVDGFVYTPAEYLAALHGGTRGNAAWHQPDGIDYPGMIDEFDLIPRIESGEIDEVWMMGLPYFGYWESAMAGKDAFEVNGGVYDQVPCRRRFVVMGFNVERGVAEMIHDQCHRTEATMTRIYGGWEADKLTTNWARFAANLQQSGTAAVGTCHYPPNAERDYDYANPRMVASTADDWLHYPNLTGRTRTFNCEEWRGPYEDARGQPDYQRNYIRWWFTHLPKAPGVNADGRLNNWWEYVYNFNAYDAEGKPLAGAKATGGRANRPR